MMDINPKGVVMPNVKKALYSVDFGSMGASNLQYWGAKRSYRDRFFYKYARRQGFDMLGAGETSIINQGQLLSFVKSVDGSAASVASANKSANDMMFIAHEYISRKYGGGFVNGKLVIPYAGANADTVCCTGGPEVAQVLHCNDANNPTSCGQVFNKINATFLLNPDPDLVDDITKVKIIIKSEFNGTLYASINAMAPNKYPNQLMYQITYKTGSGYTKYMYANDAQAASFVKTRKMEIIPFIVMKAHKNDLTKNEGVKKIIDRLGMDGDDIRDSINSSPDIEVAMLANGMELRSIFDLTDELTSGTIRKKATEVNNWPPKVLKYATEHTDAAGDTIAYTFNVGPETKYGSLMWWKKRNRKNASRYAKLMFRLLEEYGTGATDFSPKTSSGQKVADINTKLDITIEHKTGKVFDDYNRETHAYMSPLEIRDTPVGYQWFLDNGHNPDVKINNDMGSGSSFKEQLWISQIGKPSCTHDHSHDAIEGIKGGGTLIIKCLSRIIRLSTSLTTYQEMRVNDITQKISISGQTYTLRIDGKWRSNSAGKDNKGDDKYPRIFATNHIYHHAPFPEFVILKEYGMCFIVFAKKVVKTSFWKKLIGFIVAAIVCVASSGTLCAAAFQMAAIAFVVGLVLELVLEAIDSPILKALITIVVGIVMIAMGDPSAFAAMTAEVFVQVATLVLTNIYAVQVQMQMEQMAKDAEAEAEVKAGQNIEDMIDASSSSGYVLKMETAQHRSFIESNSMDAKVAQTYQGMYTFDQYFDTYGPIDMRNNVVAG